MDDWYGCWYFYRLVNCGVSILKHPLLLFISAVAVAIYFAKIGDVALPNWIYFYLGDLLCMSLVLSLCLATVRIVKKNDTLYIPLGTIIALTAYCAMYFKWILPQYNMRYTGDIIDVGLYVSGAMLFYKFQKRLF